ncbi:pentapeptide repeat-containing protein [archaeon]|jgi:hypothetical protein|nr:pentapeptide repeat-containing protein [archaeon]MBT3731003.1 pentapeptide repeat-containing protein [archaeon]MBT4669759.1 pentapeptide repeat-containing protein [archaeon]MBT5029909.1 pentapeptide repeat-containing protein [archaeon]MBT5288481.1 pentapeptide repeat-containing protein [archaeon]
MGLFHGLILDKVPIEVRVNNIANSTAELNKLVLKRKIKNKSPIVKLLREIKRESSRLERGHLWLFSNLNKNKTSSIEEINELKKTIGQIKQIAIEAQVAREYMDKVIFKGLKKSDKYWLTVVKKIKELISQVNLAKSLSDPKPWLNSKILLNPKNKFFLSMLLTGAGNWGGQNYYHRIINQAETITLLKTFDFRKKDLRKLSLEGAELNKLDFSGADLSGSNLKKASCKNTIFKNANLSNVILYEAYLRGANLKNSICINTNFFRTDLVGADLSNAHLGGAFMKKTSLTGTNLYNTNLKDVRDLSKEEFDQAKNKDKAKNIPNNVL